jgi:hypothetical protein
LFGWCVEWTRVVLQSRLPDGRALLRAADRLRAGWSPGPVVDALVEIQRANALHQLGKPAEAVRAAQSALALAGDGGDERGRRVRTRALIALCTELVGAGRVTDAERVADVLGEHVGELGADRLAIAAWWVRAKVFDRLGDRARATECIGRAHDLVAGFGGDPAFRCRVRLAWVAIGLRGGAPDLDRIAAVLDEVEATAVARPSEVSAHAMALRAEVALRYGEVDRCRRLAEQALATGALGQEDRLRCGLLLVRAADEVDDAESGRAAREVLVALLDQISPEAVDPVLWRDVARIALRHH